MSNEQKLREAFSRIRARLMLDVIDSHTISLVIADCEQALATTEQEPTGMPELPEADVSFEDGKDQYGYPEYDHAFSLERIKNYGEQCWKAGYKHGAWGDNKQAVNQQLTTEPVDEREAFEKWANDNATRTDLGAWDAWQARAAMAQVGDINAVESFTNDTKDAERYRWLASSESVAMNAKSKDHQWAISDAWTTLEKLDADKALIDAAIDAAMAKGVK